MTIMKVLARFAFCGSVLAALAALNLPQTTAQTSLPTANQTQPSNAAVKQLVAADAARLLSTMQDLVAIESGSRDLEGLSKVAGVISERLKTAGMTVETIPLKAPDNHILLKGAAVGSAVYGRVKGSGSKKVLLIAHMTPSTPRACSPSNHFESTAIGLMALQLLTTKMALL
jgi:glutamate carboxypeptidase